MKTGMLALAARWLGAASQAALKSTCSMSAVRLPRAPLVIDDIERAKKPVRLPVVLSRDEVMAMFAQFDMPASSEVTRKKLAWRPTGAVRRAKRVFALRVFPKSLGKKSTPATFAPVTCPAGLKKSAWPWCCGLRR